MLKKFLSEVEDGLTPNTWWKHEEFGSNKEASIGLKGLFDGAAFFQTPKPVKLLKRLCEMGLDENGIILDFFAGSCTTAHATLEFNDADGGNRKYIMVQLPEPCTEGSEALKAGYETISDIGKERIRRVINKINGNSTRSDRQMKLSGLQEKHLSLDLGFKVFKLDRSNFKIWDGSNPDATEEEIGKQLTMHVDHVLPSATQEDLLYELLIKSGFKPTERVERLEMAGKTVFSISEGALLICLEDRITRELIDDVAKAEPMQFICLDKGFKGNDQLKANAVQTFAARNQGRDKANQIIFKTV